MILNILVFILAFVMGIVVTFLSVFVAYVIAFTIPEFNTFFISWDAFSYGLAKILLSIPLVLGYFFLTKTLSVNIRTSTLITAATAYVIALSLLHILDAIR